MLTRKVAASSEWHKRHILRELRFERSLKVYQSLAHLNHLELGPSQTLVLCNGYICC
jgi:hypothetical protein